MVFGRELNGPVLPEPDPALCRALAADLGDAGFAAEALRAAWGEVADDRHRPRAARAGRQGPRRPRRPAGRARSAPRARDAAAHGIRRGRPARALAPDGLATALRPRGSAGTATRRAAGDRPTAVVRRRPRHRASGGSRATSTRRPSAERSPRTTCSASAVPRSTLAGLQLPTPGRARPGRRRGMRHPGPARTRARRPTSSRPTSRSARCGYTRLNALLNGVDGDPRRGSGVAVRPGRRESSSTGSSRIRRSSSRRGSPVSRRTSTATAGCVATTSSRPSSPAWAPISLRAG